MRATVEKKALLFGKEGEEIKCNYSGASFVARAKEEKARAVQEAISALMKRHRAEMRDTVEADSKEARARFTEAVNAAVEGYVSTVRAKLDLRKWRDVKEAMRVAKDNNNMRRDQEKEETLSYVQSSIAE